MISKLGLGSRTQAGRWVREGQVRVNGRFVTDPEFPVNPSSDRITVAGRADTPARLVVMLNKPRCLVTTTSDEQGRDTVYKCFEGAGLPWLAPVGRLDKASEGLLLFSNDPMWAARITHPSSGPDKTYHVQIDRLPDALLLKDLEHGVKEAGEWLAAKSARCLRSGDKNAWLEIALDEGRNRQIRRLLRAFDIGVLRLVRVRVGELQLGHLPKGGWRVLSEREIESLAPDPFNLRRFVDAQHRIFGQVRDELQAGKKESHWMWFIFPQIKGLGISTTAQKYAITGVDEAKAYLDHPLLGFRLRECTQLVNAVQHRSIEDIFGYPDNLKFHSSMTLFAHVHPSEKLFAAALTKYFNGEADRKTLEQL